jgi:two-component system cell cycle sensor histidine kinase/response regulator CckA
VIEACNGREALERWRESGDTISALVCAIVMPGISAVSVVDQLRSVRPDLPVVFVSGHTDSKVIPDVLTEHTRVLGKPFSATTLLEAVNDLVAQHT